MNMDEINTAPVPAPEPGSETKFWGAWATIGLGLAIGLVFAATQTVVLIGFLIVKIASGPVPNLVDYLQNLANNGLLVALSTMASAITGIALIILFVRVRGNKSVSDYIGLKRIPWKTVAVVVAVFIITFMAIVGLESLYNAVTHSSAAEAANSSFMTDTYNTAGWLPLLWVAVAGFAPAFEEAFFRGFLFVGLERSRIGAVGTVIFTSLVWASLHLQYNLVGMATIVILGLVLGVVRLKTKSLWSTILFHSLWNIVALLGTAISLRGVS
jgi:membrane protease YdiL (CAAX protease family)